eukprot:TRINITY_DN403_c0_g1_i4.p1 TRINITY_DN403_c0_g1~~TRINITY_DN403_c0_g1_i4.p1  ORF type:complete len:549 (-),score=93.64 TRINITY_DN403_c0_g1_i4:117-1715(-)
MCVTTEIAGKFKLKGDRTNQLAASLNTEGFNQLLPNQRRNTTYVSRLQCVQAAIESQLDNLKKEYPNYKVGLVCFNGDVVIIGDGTKEKVIVTGDKLNNYETLINIGREYNIENSILTCEESLVQKLRLLEETGPTALGPAVAVCVGMAGKYPGSKIVVATDGLANTGIGCLDDHPSLLDQNTAVYTSLSQLAKQQGTTISVIGIKGTTINMDALGVLADTTGGHVDIVDPENITTNFGSIVDSKLVATNVVVKLFLHKGFTFPLDGDWVYDRNTTNTGEKSEKHKLYATRTIGNAFVDTEITAEFTEAPTEVESRNNSLQRQNVTTTTSSTAVETTTTTTTTSTTVASTTTTTTTRNENEVKQTNDEKMEDQILNKPEEIVNKSEKKELPFQVQITYTALSGMICTRVITRTKEVTSVAAEVEKEVDVSVLGMHANYVSALKAQAGDISGAIQTTETVSVLLRENIEDDADSSGVQAWEASTVQFNNEARAHSMAPPSASPTPKNDSYSNRIYGRKNCAKNKAQFSNKRKY